MSFDKITMLCPVCGQPIKEPVSGYHVKPIPVELMSKDAIPDCEMPKCKNKAKWNVNNGHAICDKHFRGLCETGKPVFVLSKSILKEGH